MIPLRDNIRSRTTPFVNYLMIGVCTVAFIAQLATRDGPRDALIDVYAMVPVRVLNPDRPIVVREVIPLGPRWVERERVLQPLPFNPWLTLLTCTFLHGGWLHFLGNMWFLHIFGDNVEDRIGHAGYLLFYLGCGVAASFAHLLFNPQSPIPTVGASGAIAGVMGAYFLLYPRAMVLALVPLVVIFPILVLPAPIFLGIWFVIQFLQGAMATGTQAGGVAWWAHIGGFIAGVIVAALLQAVGETSPAVEEDEQY